MLANISEKSFYLSHSQSPYNEEAVWCIKVEEFRVSGLTAWVQITAHPVMRAVTFGKFFITAIVIISLK
jgi:hypothetical protein